MLVLTLKIGQSIIIGEDTTITATPSRVRGHVGIGVDAPKEKVILRSELATCKEAITEARYICKDTSSESGRVRDPDTLLSSTV